jgi:hypothetical protein
MPMCCNDRMSRTIFFLVGALLLDSATAGCVGDKSAVRAEPRFKIIGEEAYDRTTNLTWQRCSAGATWDRKRGCIGDPKMMSLADAKQLAANAGKPWRLPTIQELYSIVEPRCSNPAIDPEVFPGVKSLGEGAPYWSSSKINEMPRLFYYLDFMSGEADGHTKGFSLAVRLVRGGK